jgi:DNA repair photolyase
MRGVEIVEQQAKSVINAVAGMPFKWSINPYRGCYHQCRFCYARRTHTYLEEDGVNGWGSKIYVKVNAAAVVRSELAKRSWKRETVAIGTVTDPYQPLEGRYRITRGILEAMRDYQSPANLITRSPLVVRDIDVLQDLSRGAGTHVSVSISTLDTALAREIEPTVAPPGSPSALRWRRCFRTLPTHPNRSKPSCVLRAKPAPRKSGTTRSISTTSRGIRSSRTCANTSRN